MATKKETVKKDAPAPAATEASAPKRNTAKRKVKLTDEVRVVSCVSGSLVYISSKTGYRTTWNEFGAFEIMTVSELMTMRNEQPGFFENHWVVLTGDNANDVVEFLRLEKYFDEINDLTDIDNLFRGDAEDLPRVIAQFTPGAKEMIARRAYDLIRQHELTDVHVIRALESALGYELMD